LLNIIKNATEAVGDGGSVLVESADVGEAVRVTISDNGPGIPEHVMGRIFEPFFTTKEVGLGTGLGLSISREVIEHHGGHIRVENQTSSGARFTISLPKRDSRSVVPRTRTYSEPPGMARVNDGGYAL
jgi:signal transduction histidine kinase